MIIIIKSMLLQPLLGEDVQHLIRVQLKGVHHSLTVITREDLDLAAQVKR